MSACLLARMVLPCGGSMVRRRTSHEVDELAAGAEWSSAECFELRIVGSFRGIYRWNPVNHKSQILDYFTNEPCVETSMIPISDNLICGYSEDLFDREPMVFDFAKGVEDAKGQVINILDEKDAMSDLICETAPMSLWNVALELHVGRCYSPFLGPLSDLFVFLSGLLITLVLLSGYIISHRRRKKAQARLK